MSGLTFNVSVTLDAGEIMRKADGLSQRLQPILDSMVLQDSNYFIPKKTGTLEKSSIINSKIGSGELIWRTPYARRQYYGDGFDHSKQHNPNACSRWAEAAKARWFDKWVRFLNEQIKR